MSAFIGLLLGFGLAWPVIYIGSGLVLIFHENAPLTDGEWHWESREWRYESPRNYARAMCMLLAVSTALQVTIVGGFYMGLSAAISLILSVHGLLPPLKPHEK